MSYGDMPGDRPEVLEVYSIHIEKWGNGYTIEADVGVPDKTPHTQGNAPDREILRKVFYGETEVLEFVAHLLTLPHVPNK